MPRPVIFALIVEMALVLLSLLLLMQPKFFLALESPRAKSAASFGGLVTLCLTFCWSVVLGCLLALNSVTLTI